MRAPSAIVYAALLAGLPACTLDPTGGDGGSATSTTGARTRGDQCMSVLSAFCQKAASCAIAVDQTECTQGNLSLCCVGTACDAPSTISETTVSECSQTIMAEDCNDVVNTTNPTSCLGPP